ncbi:MAG: ABC transporter permease subunit [Alphaproteobacteria bacterium]|nr:ABC transporter permease subunit [Alphaproteobacteria bacterium]MCB9699231.1 ABC transporter permease subunit [Alphaproteobacteria bacterium]
MSGVWHVARREILEQRRQPAMLAVVTSLYVIVAGSAVTAVAALATIEATPVAFQMVEQLLPGTTPSSLVHTTLSLQTFLGFTQYLGISAVACGHAVLHDRQCGTFTFLLMAPIRRSALLAGKVLGAVALPTAGYVVVNLSAGLIELAMPIAQDAHHWLPTSLGWWVALLAGGPSWSLWVGAICASISSLARDVRTAQQATWFVVFFASLAAGGMLTWSIDAGLMEQMAVVLLAVTGAATALSAGAALLSRDVGR